MTTVTVKNVESGSMVLRTLELAGCPMDCTFYRADLLKGFTLGSEDNILDTGMHPCVSPLPRDGDVVHVPASEFSGGIIRLGWVTEHGCTIFRWYLLSKTATHPYAVLEVKQFVQRRRNAVQYQTIFVPDRR